MHFFLFALCMSRIWVIQPTGFSSSVRFIASGFSYDLLLFNNSFGDPLSAKSQTTNKSAHICHKYCSQILDADSCKSKNIWPANFANASLSEEANTLWSQLSGAVKPDKVHLQALPTGGNQNVNILWRHEPTHSTLYATAARVVNSSHMSRATLKSSSSTSGFKKHMSTRSEISFLFKHKALYYELAL